MANNDVDEYKHQYMGDFWVPDTAYQDPVDGRFLVVNDRSDCTITDLFHSKAQTFRLDFSSTKIDGKSMVTNNHEICEVFLLDMNNPLFLFELIDYSILCLGVGMIDVERSTILVEQAVIVSVSVQSQWFSWYPLSSAPNLYDGFVLKMTEMSNRRRHFLVKMAVSDELRISALDVPLGMSVVGCCDNHLYGFALGQRNDHNADHPIDLIKFSLSDATLIQERTINWEIATNIATALKFDIHVFTCGIGRKLVVENYRGKEETEILSLDLDTFEWKSTDIILKNVRRISSDGTKTLIVQTQSHVPELRKIHRFVFNQPDKLSDLAWFQLKRIFDARPDAYNTILSRLPKNLKQKCFLNFN